MRRGRRGKNGNGDGKGRRGTGCTEERTRRQGRDMKTLQMGKTRRTRRRYTKGEKKEDER